MNLDAVMDIVIKPGLKFLPDKFSSEEAVVMLLAIGLQESRFKFRKQIRGPARGFFQFEKTGIEAILEHPSSEMVANCILNNLEIYRNDAYEAVAYNDALATVFARLLLYTHPKPLPTDKDIAWKYYLDLWRPGKPKPSTWESNWNAAVRHVMYD